VIDPTQHAIARMRSIRALGAEVAKAKEAISKELMRLRAGNGNAELIARLEKLQAAERHTDVVLFHLIRTYGDESGVKEEKCTRTPKTSRG
jgi:ferredoxin-NADP reductase